MHQPDIDAIEALIDGELTGKPALMLKARIMQNPDLRAQYIAISRQKALLRAWWQSLSHD